MNNRHMLLPLHHSPHHPPTHPPTCSSARLAIRISSSSLIREAAALRCLPAVAAPRLSVSWDTEEVEEKGLPALLLPMPLMLLLLLLLLLAVAP